MNIYQYFQQYPQEKSYVDGGRIFQPLYFSKTSETIKIVLGVRAVVETDSELSYTRLINPSWWDRTKDHHPDFQQEWELEAPPTEKFIYLIDLRDIKETQIIGMEVTALTLKRRGKYAGKIYNRQITKLTL